MENDMISFLIQLGFSAQKQTHFVLLVVEILL